MLKPGSFQKGLKVNSFFQQFWVAYYFLVSYLFNQRKHFFSSPLPNDILADCFFAGDRFLLGYVSREDKAIAFLTEVWDDLENYTEFKSFDVFVRICETPNK